MNLCEAMEALKPFSSKVPGEALAWIRANGKEAEPVLVEEIDEKLKTPAEEDRDARFLYAIHLCAEMRCREAYPRYLALCRLPNVVQDHVLGDILTESIPEMLARTCAGRVEALQDLIEDYTVNEYARGGGMDALRNLMLDGEISREWLGAYCVTLMKDKLLRCETEIWNSVIGVATSIQADGALPLIEKAYERGLADPTVDDLDRIRGQFAKPLEVVLDRARRWRRPLDNTEQAMGFFVQQWGAEEDDEEPDRTLLDILKERRTMPAVANLWVTGRNAPCPCGSGRKYKKCCMVKSLVQSVAPVSVQGHPILEEHRSANDWMEAGYLYNTAKYTNQWMAFECWKNCWSELRNLLPPMLLDPEKAEDTGAFAGCEFLHNWLQDFEILLIELSGMSVTAGSYAVQYIGEVLDRFPAMDDLTKGNMDCTRARCLAQLGKHNEAQGLLERMIAAAPGKAQGYVVLAEMCGLEAAEFNLKLDLPGAMGHLRRALEHASDCKEYDVSKKLEELEKWQKEMAEPL